MKKLVFAAVAGLCASLFAEGEIVSANIVGYNQKGTAAAVYPMFGACFLPINGATQYKLGDIKVTGMDPGSDQVQLISNSDLAITEGMYVYLSAEIASTPAEVGWYDTLNGSVGDPDSRADDVLIDNGTCFLGWMESGNEITFQFAGEAPTTATSISTDGCTYPHIANYIPRAIPLNWIVVNNMDPGSDQIQSINSNNLADTTAMYVYLSVDVAADPSEVGWYDTLNGSVGDPDSKVGDDVLVQPGEAFLGWMESGNELEFCFPSSTKSL